MQNTFGSLIDTGHVCPSQPITNFWGDNAPLFPVRLVTVASARGDRVVSITPLADGGALVLHASISKVHDIRRLTLIKPDKDGALREWSLDGLTGPFRTLTAVIDKTGDVILALGSLNAVTLYMINKSDYEEWENLAGAVGAALSASENKCHLASLTRNGSMYVGEINPATHLLGRDNTQLDWLDGNQPIESANLAISNDGSAVFGIAHLVGPAKRGKPGTHLRHCFRTRRFSNLPWPSTFEQRLLQMPDADWAFAVGCADLLHKPKDHDPTLILPRVPSGLFVGSRPTAIVLPADTGMSCREFPIAPDRSGGAAGILFADDLTAVAWRRRQVSAWRIDPNIVELSQGDFAWPTNDLVGDWENEGGFVHSGIHVVDSSQPEFARLTTNRVADWTSDPGYFVHSGIMVNNELRVFAEVRDSK